MLGINDFGLFVVSGLMLSIIPGPDSLYVIGRGASQGFKSGSIAALGIGSGTLVHILAAAFGLSAILAASSIAFTIVKYIGAIYLIYMAYTMLMNKGDANDGCTYLCQSVPLKKVFYQGFLTNILNPKVALFFLAFVPQFIGAEASNKILSFIVLGLVFNINAILWCHVLAWFSSFSSKKIKKNESVVKWLNRVSGGIFAYFGLRLALSE